MFSQELPGLSRRDKETVMRRAVHAWLDGTRPR
jgi:hypothetical protein